MLSCTLELLNTHSVCRLPLAPDSSRPFHFLPEEPSGTSQQHQILFGETVAAVCSGG